MNKEDRQIIAGWRGKKVLVVGDVMLDEYTWGEVERISPEAPVPVVRVKSRTWASGGAANVAHNIASLGGWAELVGVIGRDHPGRRLRKILRQARIGDSGLIMDGERPTVTKSRLLAGHQQVVRIDTEATDDIEPGPRRQVMKQVRRLIAGVDVVVLEDYSKGLLDQEMVDGIISLARAHRRPVVADPNENHCFTFRGTTLATPNRREAIMASNLPPETSVPELGRSLLRRWGSQALLITLGEDGMCLFERRRRPFLIPTVAREVFDVSGAGDTVVGTVALALSAGADLRVAARLANYAAGVVVGKLGTATLSAGELLAAVSKA